MGETASKLGATYLGHQTCRFRVWAPLIAPVGVRLLGTDRLIPLEKSGHGYHEAIVEGVAPGDLYRYRLGPESERADPTSRSQPQGVHGPSAIVDEQFSWDDPQWSGPALDDYVIYELHIGAFTPEGTFEAVIPHLDHLADLGITAVELMPVAEFPGRAQLGLRRRLSVRGAPRLRRPRRLKKIGRRLPSAGSRGRARRRLQPSRSRR